MKTRVFDSIHNVPKEQWNHVLAGHSCTQSHEFWDVVERSDLNDFTYHHAIFYDDADNPVALASFYSITTDIAIFAPAALRNILLKIRRLFPNFLMFRMLECGTPITISKPFVAINAGSQAEVIKSLGALLLGIAKKQGHFLIVVRDFEPESDDLQPAFKNLGFHLVDSLPTTYLEIAWATHDEYVSSMKSYYRSKLLKHLNINQQQGVRHDLRADFADLAEVLYAQWRVVHDNASEYQREILTPGFYRSFSSRLGASSKVLLFYRQDELIGHALLLMDGEMLRWLYFGRNDAINDSLYIYVGNAVIETAILLGAKRLELGLTTYAIKKDLGAYMSPIMLALRSPSSIINPFVGMFYPLLNHTPEIQNKNIYKSK